MNGLHDVLFHSLVNSFCNSNISTGIWSMSSCVKFCLVKWTNGNDPWNHLILRSSTIFDNNFHLVRCLLYSWGKCITGLGAAADSCRGGRPDVRGKIGFLCQHLLVCKDDHQVELGGPNRDQVGYFVNLEDFRGSNIVVVEEKWESLPSVKVSVLRTLQTQCSSWERMY